MEKICDYSRQFMDGVLSKDEYLVLAANSLMKLNDAQAMAFAVIMGGEESDDED